MNRMSAHGRFTNGKKRSFKTSSFALDRLNFKHEGNNVEIRSFKILNFNTPLLRGKIRGKWEIGPADSVYLPSTLAPQEGEVNLHDVLVLAWFEENNSDKLKLQDIKVNGVLTHKGVGFSYKDSLLVSKFEGEWQLQEKDLFIKPLAGTLNKKNDFVGSIQVHDFQPLLQKFITGHIPQSVTSVKSELQFNNLDLNQLMVTESQETGSTETGTNWEKWVAKLNVDLTSRVENFRYGRFKAHNMEGQLKLEDNVLTFRPVTFQTMEGRMKWKGRLKLGETGKRELIGNLNMSNVNIQQLFYQMDNFGQQTLTDKHLRGQLTTDIYARLPVQRDYSFLWDSIFATADVRVEKGELIEFEPTQYLSDYVNVEALKHIKFSELNNRVKIKDQVIHIPSMDIYSNAMNLTLAGTHTFNNRINYKIKVKLSQLLSKKVNKNPAEWEKNKKGGLNLFLTMQGPLQNPDIKYDKRSVREKIDEDLEQEKQEVKETFQREFGNKKEQDTVKEWDEQDDMRFIDWQDTTQSP